MTTNSARRMLGLLTVAGALAWSAVSAEAATITTTITGHVAQGAFSGTAYQADFSFDTSLGAITNSCISGTCPELLGGTGLGLSNPLISATLGIGASSYNFTGAFNSALALTDYSVGLTAQDTGASNGTLLTFSVVAAVPGSIPVDLLSTFSVTNLSSNTTAKYCISGVCTGLTVGSLTEKVVIPSVGTTPVPGALPLFAFGLLGLAAAARRRGRSMAGVFGSLLR